MESLDFKIRENVGNYKIVTAVNSQSDNNIQD